MDWSLLIGLLALLALGVTGAFFLYRLVARTRMDFRAHQPAVRVTNLSAMNAGPVLTLNPEVENLGPGVAFDCVMQLGGWEGNFSVRALYPQGPRYRKHAVAIVLGPDTPIRTKPLSNGYLRLAYKDRWGLTYECWYPVVQVPNAATPLYSVRIDLDHPDVMLPNPSFWEIRKLLRSQSLNDSPRSD